MSAPDYSFTRRRRWIVGHLIVIAAIVAFVAAGLWQLSRLEERRELNATITARAQGPPTALPSQPRSTDRLEALEWQLVEFEAVWATDDEVILQARSLNGVSGHDVLTPARVDGVTVVVDRGWVPIDVAGPPVPEATPAAPRTIVRGVLRLSQERGSFGPVDPASGTLSRVSRVDLDRLAGQVDGALYPMWVQMLEQIPPQAEYPFVRPLPPLDEGPHLSYAVQWFLFAVVVVVGYPILLVRTARTGSLRTRRRRGG